MPSSHTKCVSALTVLPAVSGKFWSSTKAVLPFQPRPKPGRIAVAQAGLAEGAVGRSLKVCSPRRAPSSEGMYWSAPGFSTSSISTTGLMTES